MSRQSLISESKALLTTPAPHLSKETALLTTHGHKPQYHECKGYGHLAHNCRKKLFCNYCKRTGHVISECTRRPPRRNEQPTKQGQTAFQAQHSQAGIPNHDETVAPTPAQIREMINTFVASAFTLMGISGLSLPPTASHAFHSCTLCIHITFYMVFRLKCF